MAKFKFSARSEGNLYNVHPDLVKVARRALEISEIDFLITDGWRSYAEQVKLVKKGASKTLKSKHLTGRAIDVVAWVDGSYSYKKPYMIKVIDGAFKTAAKELNIPIECGIDWGRKPGDIGWDSPHVQLKDGYSTAWKPKK